MRTSTRRGLTIGVVVASALLLLLASVSTAAGATRFGAKLQQHHAAFERSTAGHAEPARSGCAHGSWARPHAAGVPSGRNKAPRGRHDRQGPSHRRASLVRSGSSSRRSKTAQPKAKVVRNGPTISYDGDADGAMTSAYTIEHHQRANFHMNRGDVIAIKAKTRLGRSDVPVAATHPCSIDPPLAVGRQLPAATTDTRRVLRAHGGVPVLPVIVEV